MSARKSPSRVSYHPRLPRMDMPHGSGGGGIARRCRLDRRVEAPLRSSSHRGPGAREGTSKASRRNCEFDQMREVLFVRKADDLALATGHFAQSSSASRVTAAQAGFFILSQPRERPDR